MFLVAARQGTHWVSLGAYGGWNNNTTTTSADELNRLGGFTGALAKSHRDAGPDQAPPPADLATAAHLGRRVAETTARFVAGRAAPETAPQPTEQRTCTTATMSAWTTSA